MKKLALLGVLAVILFLGCPGSEITTITVTPAADTTGIGLTAQFTATAYDADGGVISDVTFTWSSSSTATATVDDDGLATGVATGSCTITAASGDIEGTAALVVTSGPTHHSGSITADETWSPTANPHIIDDDISVENNATLTILPGCIVKFEPQTELYAGWTSAGAIIANGTSALPIIFTSNVSTPAAGDYDGISLYGLTISTSSFEYCTIEYAGYQATQGAFYVYSFLHAKINNSAIRYSGNTGVVVNSASAFDSFTGNTVANCSGYAVDIYPDYLRTMGTGNTYTSNNPNAIFVQGGSVTATGTWVNPGVPYVVADDISIGNNANNPVLTIAPGTTLKFQNYVEFYVGWSEPGGLVADGSTGRITFTSYVSTPSPGDWDGVSFYDNSINGQCTFRDCNVRYGGYSGYGNIYIADCLPVIEGDSIGFSSAYGIYESGSQYPDRDSLLAHNTFHNNTSGSIYP